MREEEYSLYSERWLLQQCLHKSCLPASPLLVRRCKDGVMEDPFLKLLIAQACTAWGHDYQVMGHFMKACLKGTLWRGVDSCAQHKWSPITSCFSLPEALPLCTEWPTCCDQTDNIPVMSFIRGGRTDPAPIKSSSEVFLAFDVSHLRGADFLSRGGHCVRESWLSAQRVSQILEHFGAPM